MVVRDFVQNLVKLRAMALAFKTLLSLAPLLAVVFSLLKAFGVHNHMEPALAEAGLNVTICGRREAALTEVSKENDCIFGLTADVTNEAEMADIYQKAEAARGPFDIVVANAGMAGSAPAHKTSLADWQRTLDVNLTGAFLTVKPALAGMLARKRGRIVLVASTAGLKGYAYVAPYVAAKHGVVGIMKSLANELAQKSIRVNTVHPTGVNTPLLAGLGGMEELIGLDPSTGGIFVNSLPIEFVEPRDISNAVLFLASDEAQYVTGLEMTVDAGCTNR